ncbi:vascular non-inflammatory molecule 3-like protein [Leptotrombidium deliense]|uniref:Vascular non-inflammatory molecule 3-like protein n=1 Tax=Leptotrombidium deliense TaxID=299467 RepID=A0A443S2J7_9ACAR|nr:vascular non-inflammatory molecule 3-like protein [Leptotrombidium deliense]
MKDVFLRSKLLLRIPYLFSIRFRMIHFQLSICVILFTFVYTANSRCFRAAVYEEVAVGGNFADPKDEALDNLKVYKHVVKKASENGAEIIVFPEHGLFPPFDRDTLLRYLEELPNEMGKVNPCEQRESSQNSIQYQLSCLAKENRIYLVSNMGEVEYCDKKDAHCPADGRYQYNVAVAFDNKGYLIAKYRKYHLYGESDHFDFPEKQEFTTFETPFGKFGLFVCFDSLFKEPAIEMVEKYNITGLTLPTWWFNEMPFLVAHEYQQSIAMGENINLLAANSNDPNLGSSGSGIYCGKKGALVYTYNEKTVAPILSIATLNINPNDDKEHCIPNAKKILIDVFKYIPEIADTAELSEKYKVPPLDVNVFNRIKLNKSNDEIKLCERETCCHIKYSINEFSLKEGYTYYFGAADMIRPEELGQWCEQMCVLYAYDESKKTYADDVGSRFDYFKLSAKFATKYIFPSLMTNDMKLVPTNWWTFHKNGTNSYIETKRDVRVISSGLYGRCYDRDPKFH